MVCAAGSSQFLPPMSRMLDVLLLCFVLIVVLAGIIYYVIYYKELNESPSMAYIFNTVRTPDASDASGNSDFDVSGTDYSNLFYQDPYRPAYEPVYFVTTQEDFVEKEQAGRLAPAITFNSLLSSQDKGALNYPFH